jgi:hypothetical protein
LQSSHNMVPGISRVGQQMYLEKSYWELGTASHYKISLNCLLILGRRQVMFCRPFSLSLCLSLSLSLSNELLTPPKCVLWVWTLTRKQTSMYHHLCPPITFHIHNQLLFQRPI